MLHVNNDQLIGLASDICNYECAGKVGCVYKFFKFHFILIFFCIISLAPYLI